MIESYLQEDEDYHVHSSQDNSQGKLAKTEYTVIKESENISAIKINLLTGKKNQIRVHMAENKTPVLGDDKYGAKISKVKELMLHAYRLNLIHPYSNETFEITSPIPLRFQKIIDLKDVEKYL